ncbi:hypothetical protein BsWGS_12330 [Bradybaena similaris]
MVYKVSKGGVRSGNTLRCTRSVKAKRYSSQTCIVCRSNLYPEEIPKLLSSEDALLNSTLGSTDVILSLNKKGRWRVPAEISHMIKTGHFNKGKTVVSFLERHKLRRTANCIRFVSNQERLGQVVPKQKRYFSFNLNNIDRDQSNRQLRQLKGATKEDSPKVRLITDRRKDIMKTIEVFTVSGSGKAEDVKKSLVSSKPEYRIEAFYPSPKSCSLTYNPKYTDVHMEFGPDGKMEIKSNVKPLKSTRRHRKRYSLKDLRLYEEELNANSEQELWYDEDDENDNDALLKLEDVSVLDNKIDHRNLKLLSSTLNNNKFETVVDEDQTQICDNTIASFVVQAEEESNRRGLIRQDKKHQHCKKPRASEMDDKSHIVYVSNKDLKDAQDSPPSKYNPLQIAKVILRTSEISPERLTATFGCWYQEGSSEPRRFTINMTEDINNILNQAHCFEHEGMFIAHLVFVHDRCFDEDLDVFNVVFNSNCCRESHVVCNNIPCKEMSINEIVNWVGCEFIDMKLKRLLSFNCWHPGEGNGVAVEKLVHKCLMENTTDSHRSLEVLGNVHIPEVGEDFSQYVHVLTDLDYDIFCDKCYENIDAKPISWARLLGCRHVFCHDCWRSYFLSGLNNGNVQLTCPGPGCDTIVDLVTLLSLLQVSEVSQLLIQALKDDQSASDWKLCPGPNCGRIVRHIVSQGSKFDVLCSCGHGFCFLCLSEPHWPCDCKQAQKYFEELLTLKHTNDHYPDPESDVPESREQSESSENQVFETELRICPKCSNLIEKDGGCSSMICKCGHEFCWNCLMVWNRHEKFKCIPSVPFVQKYTQKVIVRHLLRPKMFTLEGESSSPNTDVCQQKVTVYNKALEQRLEAKNNLTRKQIQEIVRQISHIAQREILVKKEILTICGVKFSDIVGSKLAHYPLFPPVEKFIRVCEESKRDVHHMAEFTLVLLKHTPASAEKRRTLRLLQDLLGYCSFTKSVLESGPDQDLQAAVRQLAEIRKWCRRAMTALVSNIEKLKGNR